MDGFVKVPVKFRGSPAGLPFTVIWAAAGSETGSSYDVQYRLLGVDRRAAGSWRSWKSNTSERQAVFGQGDEPEELDNGRPYQFRARSREGSVKSRWSPKASFTP
jgi:hypothetical protein